MQDLRPAQLSRGMEAASGPPPPSPAGGRQGAVPTPLPSAKYLPPVPTRMPPNRGDSTHPSNLEATEPLTNISNPKGQSPATIPRPLPQFPLPHTHTGEWAHARDCSIRGPGRPQKQSERMGAGRCAPACPERGWEAGHMATGLLRARGRPALPDYLPKAPRVRAACSVSFQRGNESPPSARPPFPFLRGATQKQRTTKRGAIGVGGCSHRAACLALHTPQPAHGFLGHGGSPRPLFRDLELSVMLPGEAGGSAPGWWVAD